MNTKQEATIEKLNILLNKITLVSDNVDYLSYQCLDISKNISAYDCYRMMTYKQPKWLEILFRIRDFLGRIVGIRSIKGFDKLDEKEPEIGSLVHFFTVLEKTEDTLTLNVKDSHLDVCVYLRVVDNNDKNKLYLITSVKNHNFVGKLYMLPVSIVHPYIVTNLFKNINIDKS